MSSNSELTSLVNGIVTQRSAKLPQINAQIEKLNRIETALNNLKLFSSNVSSENPDFRNKISAIPFGKTFDQIIQARNALERAQQRLSRKNISIAVAGKARQGKSQLLQMLTGLGDAQIPTGDTTFCTAARSRIINSSNNPSATIHFLSQGDFLEKKIWPAYRDDPERNDALGLSPKPNSVQEFLSSPLPELKVKSSSKDQFYKSLKGIYDDMRADPSIATKLGLAPSDVTLSEVTQYVTKDKKELPKYYHVVDYVEIRTQFAVGLPEGMEVFDLPGLGEMTPNIRETTINSVKNDADIVFFLRKPDAASDAWIDYDTDILDMLGDIFKKEEIKPNEWISLILNLDRRPSSNNERTVNSMKDELSDFKPIICDCGSQEDVSKRISENMQTLLANAEKIDSVCINRADSEFNQAVENAREVKSKIDAKKGNVSSQETQKEIKKKFKIEFEKFKANLRSPFKSKIDDQLANLYENIKNHLKEQFMNVYMKMEDYYKDNEANEEFPAEFPIFSRQRLLSKFQGDNGPVTVIEEAVRNQLWSIVELMRNLMTESCVKIRELYLDEMVKLIVDGNKAIQLIIQQENTSSDATSKEKLTNIKHAIERVDGFSKSKIVDALEDLLKLRFSYEDHILPIFYDNPTVLDFDPCYGTRKYKSFKDTLDGDSFKDDLNKQSNALYEWMKRTSKEILAPMLNDREDSPSVAISHNIFLIIKANYRQFVNQFIWGEIIEDEWRDFADNRKFVMMPDAFNNLIAKDKEFQELTKLLDALGQAINA